MRSCLTGLDTFRSPRPGDHREVSAPAPEAVLALCTYDPMLLAASFGLTPKTATYYLADCIDREHLESTNDVLDAAR